MPAFAMSVFNFDIFRIYGNSLIPKLENPCGNTGFSQFLNRFQRCYAPVFHDVVKNPLLRIIQFQLHATPLKIKKNAGKMSGVQVLHFSGIYLNSKPFEFIANYL